MKAVIALLLPLLLGGCLASQPPVPQWGWEQLIDEKNRARITALIAEEHAWAEANHDDLSGPQPQSLGLGQVARNPQLLSQEGALPGFIVPLEWQDQEVSEFLLVPYYGACIHAPPPPPNQIVHIRATEPVPFDWLRDAVWVQGVLEAEALDLNDLGEVGYRMTAARVWPY
ncbi:DUF3299 domain-containing protein [Ferrimonas balearica]|uniref:DUF3299 domain-containing protein n=1 Tax=Ferrimonas balearica TaxID=44012 RepID=UPI001C9A2637|nr:DUF3299 domain-containing protein [Ferrimonas balearica]MBY5992573.1 DUF3299 domain-containing protein [Ferrimonas balearica]